MYTSTFKNRYGDITFIITPDFYLQQWRISVIVPCHHWVWSLSRYIEISQIYDINSHDRVITEKVQWYLNKFNEHLNEDFYHSSCHLSMKRHASCLVLYQLKWMLPHLRKIHSGEVMYVVTPLICNNKESLFLPNVAMDMENIHSHAS